MDQDLITWMLKLDASAAAKELSQFAGTAEDQLDQLDDHAKALKFANTLGWAAQASPALGKTLEELAAVRKSAFGVEAAMQLAARSSHGFEDLANELSTINQLFKDGKISADIAQKAFGKVGAEGGRRNSDAAQLADDNARIEEAHWRKIDREREEAAKRLAKIAQENVLSEEAHWQQIDREREQSAQRLARETREADELRKNRIRQSYTELKTMAGMGVGAGLTVIGMAARAGFQDTLQGQQSAAYGQLLNRQVASIFAPLLEEKTKYVSQMTSWLQGLNEPQKKSIQTMTVFATSMTALSLVVPKALKAMATLATEGALGKTLQGMTAQGGALGGAAAMAGPIGMALAGTAAILASSEKGREALVDAAKSFEPVFDSFGKILKEISPVIADAAKEFARWMGNRNSPQGRSNAEVAGGWAAASANFALRPIDSIAFLFGQGPKNWHPVRGQWDPNNPTGASGAGGGLAGLPKGFEEIEAAYNRINEAGARLDLEQQTVAQLQQANSTLTQIATVLTPGQLASTAGTATMWRPFFSD